MVTGNKKKRTEHTTSDISSIHGKDPASGKSHRKKVLPQKLIADKQFSNTDHDNVDHCVKERPHKRTNPLPPLTKEKKFKGFLDIS